jgi:hypothetical protein
MKIILCERCRNSERERERERESHTGVEWEMRNTFDPTI